MAKGGSKLNGGSVGATRVMTQSGQVAELSSPLIYGKADGAISQATRRELEAQEQKRLSAKTEYGLFVDENGLVRGMEQHGSKNSMRISPAFFQIENAVFTHNHPRGKGEDGFLGGTFSDADLSTFAKSKLKTMRASAAEGTYSITKGKDFNKGKFYAYIDSLNAKTEGTLNAKVKAIDSKVKSFSSYQEYHGARAKAFNEFLVEYHNGLIKGAKECGYNYTLEKRR